MLKNAGSALEAVKAAVVVLEDNILFNAGRGSVFNSERESGNGCGHYGREESTELEQWQQYRNIRNPIELAMEVMLKSDHVFIIGEGANEFAREHGIQFESR